MIQELNRLGIELNDEELLKTALTHSSYSNEHDTKNYERLEFLGDAVLEVIVSEYLYLHSSYNEGEMSKIRANYVCEEALFNYAKEINLDKYILVGHGQENNINATIIADVLESVIAVIFLELGMDIVKRFVLNLVEPYIVKKVQFKYDYKSLLQELVQTDKKSLEYVVVSEEGPAHNREFKVEVRIDNMVYGKGSGKSKKEAEQAAALDAYRKQADGR